jgi:ATP-binding cassette subfamily F protein uup
VTFTLHEGDRVGLVGPNGAGKSTLLRILAGDEVPDEGICAPRRNLRIGWVPQHPEFSAGASVEDVVASALEGSDRAPRVAEVLAKTGFSDPAFEAGRLSGGWRTRLAIARALVIEPEVLLLDEPTNHLDLESIFWLEALLAREAEAFVVVSHDRYFLETVGRRMLDLDAVYPEGLLEVEGSYAELLEARDAALANQASYQESLANRVRTELAWLRRGPRARRTKSKARIEAAERSIEELAEGRERTQLATAGIEISGSGRKTKRLWHCRGLAKSFGKRTVVRGLDLILTPGRRVGVMGPNGSGKTTLLRMIVGEIEPDAGTIERAEGLKVAYFEQTRRVVDPALTLRRALAPEGDTLLFRDRPVHVVGWAKRFLFRPEDLDQPVSRLSGGERARIALAALMREPCDLLVLDEPTNDLDIPTLEVLEETILDFPGSLVLVTHDRFLLDRVSTEILALDGKGGVERFADYVQWEAREEAPGTRESPPPPAEVKPAKAKRLTYLEQREWEGMEERILEAEARAERARERAEDPAVATDAAALEERLRELGQAREEVERLYARWAELEEKRAGG